MTSSVSLVFVHLFDFILLTGLVHYYRRLGYGFLKFGAIAIGLNLIHEILWHLSMLPGEGGVPDAGFETAYAILIAFCALNIANRDGLRSKVAGVGATALMVAAALTWLSAWPGWVETMLLTAPSAMLFAGSAVLVLGLPERPMAVLWFAGLAALAGIAALVGQAPVSLPAIEWNVFTDLVHLLIGVTLIMLTSERAIADISRKEQRIERYAEDRKRLELQFSHAQKLESLGMLAGGIAHDFNNMLTSILGYASLAMKKLPTDSDVRKDLYMVMSGARQAVDLTSQMLTYAGKGALDFESLDISKVVENMSSLMQSIVPRKIQVVQRLGRDLPSLRGDKVQLGQVLMNMVANAVDAIEDGAGTVEVSTGLVEVDDSVLQASFFAEEREPGAYLFLRVKDTGIGMSPEQVERIFDPFYSDKRSSKGLGLSSLSGIVRQHRGFVRVSSNPGEGTDFTIFFPVLSVSDTGPETAVVTTARVRAKGQVLVADDDPRIRSLMASILESDHYMIVSAEDGKDALTRWREHHGDFDLLVLDCTMPKMSGTEVYRQLRSEGVTTPVVLVSGFHQEQVVRNIESDPCGRFVKKPFNVDDFLSEVDEALKQSRATRVSRS